MGGHQSLEVTLIGAVILSASIGYIVKFFRKRKQTAR